MIFPSIFVLFYALQLAYALPVIKPANISDATQDDVYRRDDPALYPRAASSCTQLTLAQVKALPGWSKIQQYAKNTYGDGGVNIVVNPPQYPQSGATVCIQSGPIPIKLQGTPTCATGTIHAGGNVKNTQGSVTLTNTAGFSNTASWTVTTESSLAVGVELSATIGIPAIDSVTATATTTTTITNSLSKSFSTTVTADQSASLTYATVNGKKCTGSMTTRTCNVQGTGVASYVASGYVWFNYDSARVAKNDPKGGKHYKYAVDIASVLTNINDRSSSMTFSGTINAASNTNYKGSC